MPKSNETNKPTAHTVSRRDVLKTVTIGGGVVVTKWSTPVVEGIVLPAHAAGTFGEPPRGFDAASLSSFTIIPD